MRALISESTIKIKFNQLLNERKNHSEFNSDNGLVLHDGTI